MIGSARSFVPTLPGRAWILLGGDALSWFGIGLLFPFLLIYLHTVLGIALPIAGLIASSSNLVALLCTPLVGLLVDRLGGRVMLASSTLIASAGAFWLGHVSGVWQAFGAAGLTELGQTAAAASVTPTLVFMITDKQRSSMSSVRYVGVNIGVGFGGVLGGLIVSTSNPGSFELVYTIEAITFLVYTSLVLFFAPAFKARTIEGETKVEEDIAPGGSFFALFKDRVFILTWVLAALAYTVGIAQLASGFALYAVNEGHVSTRVVGFALGANTLVVVLLQLVVLRFLVGKRRTRAIQFLFLIWIVAWAMTFVAGLVGGSSVTGVAFAGAAMLFGAGETMLPPCLPPIVMDIAPKHMLGRYTSIFTLSSSFGFIAAPALSGFLLGTGLKGVFILILISICIFATFLAWLLERVLPSQMNRVPANDE